MKHDGKEHALNPDSNNLIGNADHGEVRRSQTD